MELKRRECLNRQDAANWLAAFAIALAHGGHVQVALGGTTVRLHVPDDILSKFEIEVNGDELELDIELQWSTVAVPRPVAAVPRVVPAAQRPTPTPPEPPPAKLTRYG